MKAVIYARYSSHAQREESIEGQLRVCYDYALREGIQVLREYIDKAISGTTDDRPAFQRMIKDSASHSFDAVLLYSVDRFARDRYAAATYRHELKRNGVRIISVTQPLDDSPESILLEALLEGLAEYYSANLSRGIKRGMYENALKCQYTGGAYSLGYTVDPVTKHFVEEPVSANTVREIFSMYADGKTIMEIVRYCNQQGYRTSKGQPFSRNSLSKMLRNKRYIGYYIYKDIEIEGGMPAIVDPELFESVQRRLKMNHKARSRAKSDVDFILTGGEKYYYYSCRNHGQQCIKQNEKKDVIEDAIMDYITCQFLTDENIDKIADKIIEMLGSDSEKAIIAGIKNERKEVERKAHNIVDMIADGKGTDMLVENLRDLERRIDDLDMQLAKAEFEQNYITKDMIVFFFRQFQDGEADTIGLRRRLINALVQSIHIFDTNENQNDSESSDRGLYGLGRKLVIAFNTTADVENPVTLECSDLTAMVDFTSLYPNFISDCGTIYIVSRGFMIIAVIDI